MTVPKIIRLNPAEVLSPLFESAKNRDEFEFCCTLLRVRGLEDAYWDPLGESYELTQQLVSLIETPLEQFFRLRLLLFLYCHLTEMDDLYDIVVNLLRVTGGERYSMTPFSSFVGTPGKQPPGYRRNKRVDQLISLAGERGFPDVGQIFDEMFVRQVRNAFFHSDYVLSPSSFNIRHGEGINLDDLIERKIPLDWLVPRLELGINIALALMDLRLQHLRSYKVDKVVRGRFASDGSWMDIRLTTDQERGLIGFRG